MGDTVSHLLVFFYIAIVSNSTMNVVGLNCLTINRFSHRLISIIWSRFGVVLPVLPFIALSSKHLSISARNCGYVVISAFQNILIKVWWKKDKKKQYLHVKSISVCITIAWQEPYPNTICKKISFASFRNVKKVSLLSESLDCLHVCLRKIHS